MHVLKEGDMATLINLLTWRDSVEITLLWMISYGMLRWLAADTQKPLVSYAYSYALLSGIAYCLNLEALTTLLIGGAPVIFLLFVILHQETLQKNFIALRAIKAKIPAARSWLDELIKSVLYALSLNTPLTCIIERRDSVKNFFTGTLIHGALSHEFLQAILETAQIIVIDDRGTVISHDARITVFPDAQWMTAEVELLERWQQEAIFITSKTDAIVFHADPVTRLCDIVINGKIVHHISASHAHALIRRACAPTSGAPHETEHQQQHSSSFKQTNLQR